MLEVTIQQRRCVGNGCCADIAPEVFAMGDDDVAYLCADGCILPGDATVAVPAELEDVVLEAADECPAECIRVRLAA
jgi:ferredoxin